MESAEERLSKIYSGELPPPTVERGIEQLFLHHRELSDFIFDTKGVTAQIGGHNIADLMRLAKEGKDGPNDPPTIWLSRYLKAIREEVEELEEAIAWKWWRPDRTDMQNVRVELIDIFHFLLSASMAAGMDGGDFARVFYGKRKVNYDRQIKGFEKGDDSHL